MLQCSAGKIRTVLYLPPRFSTAAELAALPSAPPRNLGGGGQGVWCTSCCPPGIIAFGRACGGYYRKTAFRVPYHAEVARLRPPGRPSLHRKLEAGAPSTSRAIFQRDAVLGLVREHMASPFCDHTAISCGPLLSFGLWADRFLLELGWARRVIEASAWMLSRWHSHRLARLSPPGGRPRSWPIANQPRRDPGIPRPG